MNTLIVALLVFVFSIPAPTVSHLTVGVTYKPPNGVEQRIGPDVLVRLTFPGHSDPRYCVTDINGFCWMGNLPSPATVEVEALYTDLTSDVNYDCIEKFTLDQPQEFMLLRCVQVGKTWLPQLIR